MTITSLRITNFRNLAAINLALNPNGICIIDGQNASGKTSLLEAIYCLGIGRSFRSSLISSLIRQSTSKFSIFAQIMSDHAYSLSLGIEKGLNGSLKMRLAERDLTNMVELANHLPIRTIHSQSYQLLEGSPLFRRKYLDWGLFYHYEGFLSAWRHYERALKQRNSILREKCSKNELEAWTHEIIKYGLILDKFRQEYVQRLSPFITSISQHLLMLDGLEIIYLSGWNESMDYASVLSNSYQDDYRLGYTQFGPHRAELLLTFNAVPAKLFLSRGQQKLLICAMILAQGFLLKQDTNKGLIYLIDDLPSELDRQNRSKLLALLVAQQAQTFITTIERKDICECLDHIHQSTVKVFHVEQGCIAEIVGA